MKRKQHISVAVILVLLMTLALLTACDSQKAEPTAAIEKTTTVTIEVDGRQITVEDSEGKSIHELLTMAGITLGSEDMVSVDPNKTSGDQMYVLVLRMNTVTVEVNVGDAESVSYTVSHLGGTVADALKEAGVELLDNYTVQYDLDHPLENGMKILVTDKLESIEETTAEATEESTTPKPTEPKPTPTTPPSPKPTTPKPTPTPTQPKPTEPTPTTPPTTPPTEPTKTIVNVEYYYDCDGSGHGVKVITYSDGTQEEVEF